MYFLPEGFCGHVIVFYSCSTLKVIISISTMIIVAVGYEVSSDVLNKFLLKHDMLSDMGLPLYEKFLIHLESKIHHGAPCQSG